MAHYSTEQKQYIEALEKAINQAKELKANGGFVAAGWGGDTYYCYVGKDNGYKGSCFFPMTSKAVVFGTEKEAQEHCYSGYRNGNGKGDMLELHPETAESFFAKVQDHYEKSLKWAVDMWNEMEEKRK